MIHQTHTLHFECTACGQCCHGNPQHHIIEVSKPEVRAFHRFLDISAKQMRERYLDDDPDYGLGIRLNADGRCSLLDEQGRCSVYKVRPLQCQTYPFWPEILRSKRAWNQEASRCEGINQGAAVTMKYIEQQLRKLR